MTDDRTQPHHEITLDQQVALKTAATRLARDFDGTFSAETIERFLHSSYDQFAGRATVANFLPLLAERFARQRLQALAKVEGHCPRRQTDRAVPVHAQRRPLADGDGLLPALRRRRRDRLVRRLRARRPGQPGRDRRHGRARHRHLRRVPQALDRRGRPRRRRRHHHGLRRRLPGLPRQALRGMGPRRPGRPRRRRRATRSATRSNGVRASYVDQLDHPGKRPRPRASASGSAPRGRRADSYADTAAVSAALPRQRARPVSASARR